MNLSIDMPEGRRPVILSLGSPQDYLTNPHYLGVIAGRCANRIRGGDCKISGHTYQLDCNENGETHLHGGTMGFSRQFWTVVSHSHCHVELRYNSPDGEQGYPGNMSVSCLYETLPDTRLRITLMAQADKPTLANLAAHSYFNLAPGSNILDHSLEVRASHYTPVDEKLIPDGRLLPVAGTCFDFNMPARMGARRGDSSFGYDHNLVLALASRPEPCLAVRLTSPTGDMTLEIHTTEPGLQFYDGQKLSSTTQDGVRSLQPFDGCCLEPQRFPDAVHHPHFASALLPVGSVYRQVTEYRFIT